jgi:HSP20 family protein
MLIRRYEPFNDIKKSFDLVNAVVNSMAQQHTMQETLVDFNPKVNTREGESAYHIEVELPGIKKDDVEIKVDGNILSISGERNLKDDVKEENYHRVESKYGYFSRSFTLPQKVDIENIHAQSDNGILEVVIPKLTVDTTSKKIEIK